MNKYVTFVEFSWHDGKHYRKSSCDGKVTWSVAVSKEGKEARYDLPKDWQFVECDSPFEDMT